MSLVSFASDLLNHIPALPINWGTLIPVGFGFALGQLATVYRERGADKKRKINALKLLELEVEHNIFWLEKAKGWLASDIANIESGKPANKTHPSQYLQLHRKTFDSLLPTLPDVLMGGEITLVFLIYSTLDIIHLDIRKLDQNDCQEAIEILSKIDKLLDAGKSFIERISRPGRAHSALSVHYERKSAERGRKSTIRNLRSTLLKVRMEMLFHKLLALKLEFKKRLYEARFFNVRVGAYLLLMLKEPYLVLNVLFLKARDKFFSK